MMLFSPSVVTESHDQLDVPLPVCSRMHFPEVHASNCLSEGQSMNTHTLNRVPTSAREAIQETESMVPSLAETLFSPFCNSQRCPRPAPRASVHVSRRPEPENSSPSHKTSKHPQKIQRSFLHLALAYCGAGAKESLNQQPESEEQAISRQLFMLFIVSSFSSASHLADRFPPVFFVSFSFFFMVIHTKQTPT